MKESALMEGYIYSKRMPQLQKNAPTWFTIIFAINPFIFIIANTPTHHTLNLRFCLRQLWSLFFSSDNLGKGGMSW